MLRLAFDFIITWRETRTRPNAYFNTAYSASICATGACLHDAVKAAQPTNTISRIHFLFNVIIFQSFKFGRKGRWNFSSRHIQLLATIVQIRNRFPIITKIIVNFASKQE